MRRRDHASDTGDSETAARRAREPDATAIEPLRIARRTSADAFERDYLHALLRRTQGNVSRAAAIAEVSRQMVQKLMRKHGVDERS